MGQLFSSGSSTCQQNDIKVWLFETNLTFSGQREYTPLENPKISHPCLPRFCSCVAAWQAGSHDASYVHPPILMDFGEPRKLMHPAAPKTSLVDPNFENSRLTGALATVPLFFILWGNHQRIPKVCLNHGACLIYTASYSGVACLDHWQTLQNRPLDR